MADFSQSILHRLRDLYNNFNKGRVAEINDRGASYRQLSDEERTAQYTEGVMNNLGGGGLVTQKWEPLEADGVTGYLLR